MNLEKLTPLSEMKLRPEFRDTLDLKLYPTNELKIIATYAEKDMIECGMPGHHLHKKGCFVETPDHLITNIGHMCAATHLGDDWVAIERRYRERQRDLVTFESVDAFLTHAVEHRNRVDDLWHGERGGWWLTRCQSQLRRLPSGVFDKLRSMMRSGDGTIIQYIPFYDLNEDEQELARLNMNRGGAGGLHRKLGQVVALEGAKQVRLLEVKGNLVDTVRRYSSVESSHLMKNAERRACARFVGSLGQEYGRAERFLRDGQRFFTKENFAEIAKLADSWSGKVDVMKVWASIEAMPLKPSG